jgi:hypothetical protein
MNGTSDSEDFRVNAPRANSVSRSAETTASVTSQVAARLPTLGLESDWVPVETQSYMV